MDLGLYTAASGMITQNTKENMIANNFANMNTPGYKASYAPQNAFPMVLMQMVSSGQISNVGQVGTGTELGSSYTDLSQGAFQNTGQQMDLALAGPGFFAVQTPGGTEYTRSGNFTLDANGNLVTQTGYKVLGVGGSSLVPGTTSFKVAADGTMTSSAGQSLGQVQVDNFQNPAGLIQGADGYFTSTAVPSTTTVGPGSGINQGFLETSNTDQVKETVNMMSAFRAYEASQKTITDLNQTLDWAAGQVGKV